MNIADNIAEKYINNVILTSDPTAPMWKNNVTESDKAPKWSHTDNFVIAALLMLYDACDDVRLLDYSIRFTNCFVNSDGIIPSMNYADYDLENISGGRNLFKLWKITDNERYLLAFEKLWYEQLVRHPRIPSGNFWHKAVSHDQIWLEDTYMVLPFMAEYAQHHRKRGVAEDIQRQYTDIRKIMRDPVTGLYYHGYDDTYTMLWADSITGLSSEFWLRSISQLCAALADTCEMLPESTMLREQLNRLLTDLSAFRRSDGMLLQLPARSGLEGNYPETSGSLLFAYAALKAARLGISSEEIRMAGKETFSAVAENFIDNSTGIPVLKNICLGASLGDDIENNGSAESYIRTGTTENDGTGIAAFLMAYTEFKKI